MEGQPENGKSRFQAALLVGMMKRFWVEMFANCLRQPEIQKPEIQNGTAAARCPPVYSTEYDCFAKMSASRRRAIRYALCKGFNKRQPEMAGKPSVSVFGLPQINGLAFTKHAICAFALLARLVNL